MLTCCVIVDRWLLLCVFAISKESEHHYSMGSLIDGAHPGPKTDRDNQGGYCPKTFETAKGKKKSGAAEDQTQGIWLKPPVLCH